MDKFDCFEDPNLSVCLLQMCHERIFVKTDVSGVSTTDRFLDTSTAQQERVQTMNLSNHACIDCQENVPVNVNNVCHFFTEFNMLMNEPLKPQSSPSSVSKLTLTSKKG